ncbi:hypothetical protein A3860_23755 [Niastella vici]|uniref:Uncharacterized protein n=1 Tax=Niastella vici TaxID=1703345 RepID=A0A1V9FYH0_9BACT|nr:hypothetical protein [Niastella vici]OQP63367.1 hypothetical protein A3860_23755 [Niastella vici]
MESNVPVHYCILVRRDFTKPVLITGSITDLINDHVITLTDQDGPYFDNDKYPENSLQQQIINKNCATK